MSKINVSIIKKTSAKAKVFLGRAVGFEPTHIGTTIRGLNRLTTPAISQYIQYQLKIPVCQYIRQLIIF